MEIRAMTPADPGRLADIDGTIESARYLHIESAGSGLAQGWRLEERPLREKRISPNPVDDEARFAMTQIATGMDEGLALVAEHDGELTAALVARPAGGVLRLLDLRVDYDFRRQGVGAAMLYRSIQEARERELRAVMTVTRTDNVLAAHFLLKGGFELAGLDLRMWSNHDLVKESVGLFWYASLD
jgi:ribosomal protein S18 acetylase RimI-like enzyme